MDVVKFEQMLDRQHRDFELLDELDQPVCHVRFTGPFCGETIIWNATLMTLAHHVTMLCTHEPFPAAARQYITVGDITPAGRRLQIALNVPIIDEPTVRKAMIMIRQYKRLAPGRHEYGEVVQP